MFISPIDLVIVLAAVGFGGFYCWAQQRGLLTTGQAAEGEQGTRRISLLTEAGAYAGVILLLVGGVTAISQRWNDIGRGGQGGVLAAAAVFFFLVGIIVRQVREPAIQRLAGVAWFLSVAGVAGAVWLALYHVHGTTDAVTAVAVGAGVTLYAAALWLIRRSALQSLALFAGLVITILGIADIITVPAGTGPAPAPAPNLPTPLLAIALPLWVFGLAWAGLGWRRYVGPLWVTIPCGVILALIAPSFAAGHYGWMYVIGIATAAAAMAASVPLRNTPLLALGALTMFGYLTAVAARYLHQSLGGPSALAITGVLIIGLAVASARLTRAALPPKPSQSGADEASHPALRAGAHRSRRGSPVVTPGPSQGLLGRRSARHAAGQAPPPAGPAGLILPADRAGRVHRLAGAGIRSRARCPRQGRDRSFGHGTDVTEEDGSDERRQI